MFIVKSRQMNPPDNFQGTLVRRRAPDAVPEMMASKLVTVPAIRPVIKRVGSFDNMFDKLNPKLRRSIRASMPLFVSHVQTWNSTTNRSRSQI